MSGSGPTVFGLFDDEELAKRAFTVCKEDNPSNRVYLTDFYKAERDFSHNN